MPVVRRESRKREKLETKRKYGIMTQKRVNI